MDRFVVRVKRKREETKEDEIEISQVKRGKFDDVQNEKTRQQDDSESTNSSKGKSGEKHPIVATGNPEKSKNRKFNIRMNF